MGRRHSCYHPSSNAVCTCIPRCSLTQNIRFRFRKQLRVAPVSSLHTFHQQYALCWAKGGRSVPSLPYRSSIADFCDLSTLFTKMGKKIVTRRVLSICSGNWKFSNRPLENQEKLWYNNRAQKTDVPSLEKESDIRLNFQSLCGIMKNGRIDNRKERRTMELAAAKNGLRSFPKNWKPIIIGIMY